MFTRLKDVRIMPPGPDDFDPDYSERDEFAIGMRALVHFIVTWNLAELHFNNLVASFGGEMGAIYALGLGNQSKIDALMEMAEAADLDEEFHDAVKFACKAFHILKSNRNALAHTHTIAKSPEDEKPHWIRQPKNPKSYTVFVYADEDDVGINWAQSVGLTQFLMELCSYSQAWHGNSRRPAFRGALPEKFPLPTLLNPHSLPRSDIRPSRQS